MDNTYKLSSAGEYALMGSKVLIAFVFLAAIWVLMNTRTFRLNDHKELFETQNSAYAAERVGLIFAVPLALGSSLSRKLETPWLDIKWLMIGGGWMIVVLVIVSWLASKLMKFNVDANKKTLAVGIMRGSLFVAISLVINGSLAGTAPDFWTGVKATVIFTGLGLAFLTVAYKVSSWLKHLDLDRRIRGGDVVAAMIGGGFLIGLGGVMQMAIAGPFTDWTSSFVGFAVVAVVGLVIFLGLALLIDWLVIRKSTIIQVMDQTNIPAGLIMGATFASVGLIFWVTAF